MDYDKRSDIVVGVDVSVRRGLDVVVLDGLRVVEARAQVVPESLGELLGEWKPAAVAIDSPPGRGREPGATSRACERAIRERGVNIFRTPSDEEKFAGAFYDWVRVGTRAYEAAAAAGYPLQTDPGVVFGCALEVFPHAADVFVRGCLPPLGTTKRIGTKRVWRLATLHLVGVDTDALCRHANGTPTMDSIDAALAALTARYAVDGNFTVFGSAGELIVVPGTSEGPRFTRSG